MESRNSGSVDKSRIPEGSFRTSEALMLDYLVHVSCRHSADMEEAGVHSALFERIIAGDDEAVFAMLEENPILLEATNKVCGEQLHP